MGFTTAIIQYHKLFGRKFSITFPFISITIWYYLLLVSITILYLALVPFVLLVQHTVIAFFQLICQSTLSRNISGSHRW